MFSARNLYIYIYIYIFTYIFCTIFYNTDFLLYSSYAESQQVPRSPSSHMKAWWDLTEAELDDFLALRLLMGIDSKGCTKDYWSTDSLHAQKIFPETMSRDRFASISKNLHLEDNEGDRQEGDRLWKIRTVLDRLNVQCQNVFTPERVITVDESLWKYRGRLHFVQFNPSKRARYGLKVYKLSASTGKAAGYTSSFRIYTGQDKIHKKTNVSMDVVVDLLDGADLFWKGYTVCTDNWYSSPDLFHLLQSRKTNAVGTVNMRRKWMPKEAEMKLGKPRGSTAVMWSPTGMMCLQWVDKKVVTLLSTCHSAVMLPITNRRGKEVLKPNVVVEYSKGKLGVDLSDQLATSYPTARKSPKWYKKLLFFLLDMMVVNAFAVYKYLECGSLVNQLEFRRQLIRELLHRGTSRRPLRPVSASSVPPQQARYTWPVTQKVFDRLTGHYPSIIGDGKTFRRCYLCWKDNKKRSNTKTQCLKCNVKVCTYGCFEKHHSQTLGF